jgi:hypothetical protein
VFNCSKNSKVNGFYFNVWADHTHRPPFSFLSCQNVIGFADLGRRVLSVRILAHNSSVALFKLTGHIGLLLDG